MALLKTKLKNGEIAIFDEAVIYKRGEYWQFRMWLVKESKYVRQSLKTRSEATAYDKAKSLYHQLHANEPPRLYRRVICLSPPPWQTQRIDYNTLPQLQQAECFL